jgi:hypothetical protein
VIKTQLAAPANMPTDLQVRRDDRRLGALIVGRWIVHLGCDLPLAQAQKPAEDDRAVGFEATPVEREGQPVLGEAGGLLLNREAGALIPAPPTHPYVRPLSGLGGCGG